MMQTFWFYTTDVRYVQLELKTSNLGRQLEKATAGLCHQCLALYLPALCVLFCAREGSFCGFIYIIRAHPEYIDKFTTLWVLLMDHYHWDILSLLLVRTLLVFYRGDVCTVRQGLTQQIYIGRFKPLLVHFVDLYYLLITQLWVHSMKLHFLHITPLWVHSVE